MAGLGKNYHFPMRSPRQKILEMNSSTLGAQKGLGTERTLGQLLWPGGNKGYHATRDLKEKASSPRNHTIKEISG